MTTVVIGTAGHIDHGKSALVEALTGVNPDRLKEERERGITIDLGFANAIVGDVNLAFVDVPGHERFVRNMLAGAGGIDAVLLVVAANESVMPQTREHFEICRLLGVTRGVIALTKSDLVDASALQHAAADVRRLVAGCPLSGAEIVPVSARSGDGLDRLRAALAGLAAASPRRGRSGVARLPVDRAFTIKGAGAVVTGTLVSGRITEADHLVLLPAGLSARARAVQVHGRLAKAADAPERVAVNLAGVGIGDLHRGMTLASPGRLAVTARIDVHLELLGDARPLRHGTRVRVHQGTAEVIGRVAVGAVRDQGDEHWRPARPGDQGVAVPPGGEAYVRIRLERPLVVTRGDRVVLRAYSPVSTIAGGAILDPEPPVSGVRRSSSLGRFERLRVEGEASGVFLSEAGGRGLTAEDLVRRGGLTPGQAEQQLGALVSAGLAIAGGRNVFAVTAAARMRDRIEGALADWHARAPREPGVPLETLRRQAGAHDAGELFEAVIESLRAERRIHGRDRIALQGFEAPVTPEESDLLRRVESRLKEGGLMPPDPAGLAGDLRVPAPAVEQALRALAQDGRVVKTGGLFFHSSPLAALKSAMQASRAGQPPGARVAVDVGAFKSQYGLTRKFAIPLLEWLDRERVTRRVGEGRILI